MRRIQLLSVVVPCHNEQEVLPQTHERLSNVLKGFIGKSSMDAYEIVFVDNGSTDNTLSVLEKIFEQDKQVRIIALKRDFGYQGSISAGIGHARGDAVVTIDADLQDPPEKISEMITKYNEGYDLVLGIRKDRSTDSFVKRFCAQNYYRLLKLLGVEIVYNHGDFRLMGRSLVDEFNSLPERNRLIRAMILRLDARYATVDYKREARKAGRSKFNITSILSLSLDGITSFSYIPLRLASVFGFMMCCVSFIFIFWVLYVRFFTSLSIPGWASTLLPLLLIGGFQLLVLGIIGEYLGRLYIEVKQRPLFTVRKQYNHDE